jgi:hypothetical protein
LEAIVTFVSLCEIFLNQTAPFEVADILAGGALGHFDGELEQQTSQASSTP